MSYQKVYKQFDTREIYAETVTMQKIPRYHAPTEKQKTIVRRERCGKPIWIVKNGKPVDFKNFPFDSCTVCLAVGVARKEFCTMCKIESEIAEEEVFFLQIGKLNYVN